MSVSNGQQANQTTFNNAFMSRTVDDNTTGKKDLQNADAPSGPDVINLQREINSLNAFTGRPSGSAHDADPSWTNNDVGSSTDDVKQRADLLTERFNQSTGHTHDGTAGEGPQIDSQDLANVPMRGYVRQGTNLTAAGLDDDISAQFALKSPSLSSSQAGVPTTAPYNRVLIKDAVSLDPIEDGSGNEVYGRITNSGGLGGTWTLTYYSDVAGVETAYSFSSTLISFWYQELFTALDTTAPVYSEDFFLPSDNATNDVIDASPTQSGKVSTGAQSFAGEKELVDGLSLGSQDIASAATITALSSTKSEVRITGATATELQGITAPASGKSKLLILLNVSSATITVKNENAGASANNRIKTTDAADLSVAAGSSVIFIYDTTQLRWIVLSSGAGSGSGGGAWKEAVRVVSTSNLNLASMPAAVDGVTLASGDRFLAAGQTTGGENGIYVFNGAAVAATRSTDFDTSAEVVRGLSVYVVEGTAGAHTIYTLKTAGPYTLGTTSLSFVQNRKWNKENLTLNGTDITNQYKDLAFEVVPSSLIVSVSGNPQTEGVDYTTSVVSSVTRITFAGDLATAGDSALISGDILNVQYQVRA